MKSSLDVKYDVEKTSNASKRQSDYSYIKIDDGKNFIRLLSKEFVTEFIHVLEINSGHHSVPCLGGFEGNGYAPDVCPICSEAKKHWDKRKKLQNALKSETNKKKQKELEIEIELEKKEGMSLRASQKIVMIALKGEPIKFENKDGKIVEKPKYEIEPKFLNITSSQWEKLTDKIFKENDFMKDSDDLINRNLLFEKLSKSGRNSKYTEVEISPSDKKSETPEYDKEKIPSLDSVFQKKSFDEVNEVLTSYMKSKGEEVEDDELDDLEEELEDEEEKSKKKKESKKNDDEEEDDLSF